MPKIPVIILLSSISSCAFAVYQPIWQGYLKSKANQITQKDFEIAKENFHFNDNLYSWSLGLSVRHDDSNLASLFQFQQQKTIKDTTALSLSKKTYKWGELSIEHGRTSYDLSEWSSSSLSSFSDDQVYEAYNAINYSIEFLDRSDAIQSDLNMINYREQEHQLTWKQQTEFKDFFESYTQAKLQVFIKKLNQEFEQRSKKRVDVIDKRVRDGISRKIDLLQAKSQLLAQRESLKTVENDLRKSLLVLESILERKITEKDFALIQWSRVDSYSVITAKINHLAKMQQLEEFLKKIDYEMQSFEDKNDHKLALSLSYKVNNFNVDAEEAVSDSISSGKNRSKIALLSYSIPLGGDRNDAEKKLALHRRNKAKLELVNFTENLVLRRQNNEEAIQRLKDAHEMARQRVDLAEKIVQEQYRLYLRGQAVFTETLSAEETFLNAKLNERKLLAQYDAALAEQAYWNGNIKQFLNIYRD